MGKLGKFLSDASTKESGQCFYCHIFQTVMRLLRKRQRADWLEAACVLVCVLTVAHKSTETPQRRPPGRLDLCDVPILSGSLQRMIQSRDQFNKDIYTTTRSGAQKLIRSLFLDDG